MSHHVSYLVQLVNNSNMEGNNLSVVLHGVDDLRLETTPIHEPGPGQVQLRMGRVGLCGTDIHFWKTGTIGPHTVTNPFILGHETSGIVNKLGEGVTNLKVGDRVALEVVNRCRQCDKCKTGRYNLCPDKKISGIPPYDGGLTRYHVHAADLCFKLPDNVTLEQAALMEPLCVVIHAAQRAGVTLGSRVLISGAGTIGLLELLTCKAFGAAKVCVTDVKESRLRVAKELGADFTIEVNTEDPVEFAATVEQKMNGKPNITIECSGVPFCAQAGVYATDSGGCLCIVGLGPDLVTIPLVEAALREIDIKGTNAYSNCYPLAIAMMASGKLNLKPILTHVFKIEQSLEAFELVKRGEGIKVMIDCTE